MHQYIVKYKTQKSYEKVTDATETTMLTEIRHHVELEGLLCVLMTF